MKTFPRPWKKIRFLALLLAAVCGLPGLPARGEEAPFPEVSAQSAVLMTADAGLVLFEKEGHAHRPMASTTKIMTALLALEEADRRGDPVVEITEEMTGAEGSSMGLKAGDRLTLSQLAAGMLWSSGNDAAEAIAVFVAGSVEEFARQMNERAARIGMADTRFVTPSGLDAEGHASTAYDMALLAREALGSAPFREIVAQEAGAVEFLEPAHRVTFRNHNKLLSQVEGCIGVKTGYTDLAGRCLVSAAERDGVTLIAVTLDDPDDWADHAALLEAGFARVERVRACPEEGGLTLPTADGGQIALRGGEELSLVVPKDQASRLTRRVLLPRFVYAPVGRGEAVGRLQLLLEGVVVFTVPLTAAEEAAPAPRKPGFWETLLASWEN